LADSPFNSFTPDASGQAGEKVENTAIECGHFINESTPAKQAAELGWLLDSGATRAILGDISDFAEFHQWEDQ
jgi:hypothetical protein